MTRALASAVPRGAAWGVDREARYVEAAADNARQRGVQNASFFTGDLCDLSFPNGHFDLAWSKHVLQFIADPIQAVSELVRVTRSGGKVAVCSPDGFALEVWPRDARLQEELEIWALERGRRDLGYDVYLGRKLADVCRRAGLIDLEVITEWDPIFGGHGSFSDEQRWVWERTLEATLDFSETVFGSREAAEGFNRRLLAHLDHPNAFRHCFLVTAIGFVP